MNWKYVKPLVSEDLIKEFEKEHNFKFDESFVDCVKNNNGGRPEKTVFDTHKTKKRDIKTFLSFNKEDKETIWKINEKEIVRPEYMAGTDSKLIAFAVDNFGNYICFLKDAENAGNVVFINRKTNDLEYIAKNFDEFINSLCAGKERFVELSELPADIIVKQKDSSADSLANKVKYIPPQSLKATASDDTANKSGDTENVAVSDDIKENEEIIKPILTP